MILINKTHLIILSLICIITLSYAEYKNAPKNDRAVEEALKEAGGNHYSENFKFDDIGTIKHNDTFYHAYVGYNKDGTYRIILFNNIPKYLGYYSSEYEPIDYEESAVLLDDGADGNFFVRIGKDGPLENILIDGVKTPFVINEKSNIKESDVKMVQISKPIIGYRTWVLKGKPYECIFVKKTGSKIFLKEKSRGKTLPFSERDLSEKDKEYLKSLGEL